MFTYESLIGNVRKKAETITAIDRNKIAHICLRTITFDRDFLNNSKRKKYWSDIQK